MAKKHKTHKTTAKRFRLTGTGKLVRMRGPHGHLRRRKSNRLKEQLGKTVEVDVRAFERKLKYLAGLV